MNIKEAKEQIKNAMTAYFSKNDLGRYIIPIERQRPVFLMGPPGIGKTAIMEQIAQELGVAIVTYSMTHHTRQSALGLPFIIKRKYEDQEFEVSEYTMSEIISSIYEVMEKTKKKEGILFLDEINCVSETLSPVMLQFLQYKIFGRHRVPEGWIVVTAGNPPEYNNSVREFDIVTWDRLKRIDVEPDYNVWKEYAYKVGVHPAIFTYLQIKKDNFYKVETTVGGKSFATARGWDDLSQMIYLYEINNIVIDEKLIIQYLQEKVIAKDFAIYYDLFNKYKSDYQVLNILKGNASDTIKKRAASAKFDERLSLLGLILDAITVELRDVIKTEELMIDYLNIIKSFKFSLGNSKDSPIKIIKDIIKKEEEAFDIEKKAGSLSKIAENQKLRLIKTLYDLIPILENISEREESFDKLKENFEEKAKSFKDNKKYASEKLSNVFDFCEEVFSEGQEILVLVTELTINYYCAKFIARYGCSKYFAHNKELLFYERQTKIIAELENTELALQ